MNRRPVLGSLAIVVGVLLLALTGAVLSARAFDVGGPASASVVVAVITVLFVARPIDGISAFALAMLLSETATHWSGTDLRYLDELGVPTLILAALARHRSRLARPTLGYAELGLATLLVAGGASSLVNGVPANIAIPGFALLSKGFAFFYLVAVLRLDGDDLRRMAGTVFAVTVVIALVGLAQFISPAFADEVLRLPSPGRQRNGMDVIGSVFTHPALFGWLTAFVSLFLYARFAILRTRWSLLLAIVLNAGTLLSGRRTPVIGVIAGLIVGAVRQVTAGRALARTWLLVAGAVLVIVLVSIPLFGDFYRSTLDQYGVRSEVVVEVFALDPDPEVVSELQPRVALYAGSVAIARDRLPLGAGIGRFASHMSREVYSPVYEAYGLHRTYGLRPANPNAVTDTFWPMILGESGVLGLVGALLFFGAVGVRLWRAAGRAAQRETRVFALGALLVFVEALVRSLTSAVFVAPPIAYFVFGAAGLALALERHERIVDGSGEG